MRNRPFEFRAWVVSRDKMIDWHEEMFTGSSIVSAFGSCFVDDEDVVLMQYTGLIDKDGVKIFEGDIVKIEHEFKGRTHTGKIIYRDAGFVLDGLSMSHLDNPHDFVECIKYAAVIGNVYQNPELLPHA